MKLEVEMQSKLDTCIAMVTQYTWRPSLILVQSETEGKVDHQSCSKEAILWPTLFDIISECLTCNTTECWAMKH